MTSSFVEVAVEAPIKKILTYKVPAEISQSLAQGVRVNVPLGKRKSSGVVLSFLEKYSPEIDISKIKAVGEVLPDPRLGEKTMKWLSWVAQYYLHPPGQVFAMAFAPLSTPRKRKAKKSALPTESIEPNTPPPVLTKYQKAAVDEVSNAIQKGTSERFLLFGVTGSGKTEVYLQSIQNVLNQNKKALILVPEISLTPQLIDRFVKRFGNQVAVIHSHLTPREKSDQWAAMLNGEKSILVGARSALFCPVENIGLIVLDEEHDTSFKQEEQLKYHARDAAIMKAQILGCPIVLGSATPSLESWNNCSLGKFKLLELPERVESRPLPAVQIVDMREKAEVPSSLPFWLSPTLYAEMQSALNENQQIALLLNRRGFAQFVQCPACGGVDGCPNCSVSLTAHDRMTRLVCHYCGFSKPVPLVCSECKHGFLKPTGLGTQRISDDLNLLFPDAQVLRVDRDEVDSKEKLEGFLKAVHSNRVNIIVGTQMIAKGHDFPNLTLVGVVSADIGLNFPDFRAAERTFQLLTQVAGRSGRHEKTGKVVIQTHNPDHFAIQFASRHDFRGFAAQELSHRSPLHYPPFGRMAALRIQGLNLNAVIEATEKYTTILQNIKQKIDPEIEILGPTESALSKLKNKHRYQILIKAISVQSVTSIMKTFMANVKEDSGITLSADMDPLYFL